MEEYEKFLVQVSKKAKVGRTHPLHSVSAIVVMLTSPCCKVDLMKNFKRSTARDFKINTATVTARLAEEMEDDVRRHTPPAPPPPHTHTSTVMCSLWYHLCRVLSFLRTIMGMLKRTNRCLLNYKKNFQLIVLKFITYL